jgi:hypothetical protein
VSDCDLSEFDPPDWDALSHLLEIPAGMVEAIAREIAETPEIDLDALAAELNHGSDL